MTNTEHEFVLLCGLQSSELNTNTQDTPVATLIGSASRLSVFIAAPYLHRCLILIELTKRALCTMASCPDSRIRQNYHSESEEGVNKQINHEFFAMYTYMSMSYYFDRDDVALPGFAKYFKAAADEEKEHAEALMKFQIQRGGRICLEDIKKPIKNDWGSGLEAMQEALELEKFMNQTLLDLHKTANKHSDFQMADFLESTFLDDQVEDIKKIANHITNLKRVGPGHGEYHYDHETLEGH